MNIIHLRLIGCRYDFDCHLFFFPELFVSVFLNSPDIICLLILRYFKEQNDTFIVSGVKTIYIAECNGLHQNIKLSFKKRQDTLKWSCKIKIETSCCVFLEGLVDIMACFLWCFLDKVKIAFILEEKLNL